MATPFPSVVVHDAVADRHPQALSFRWDPVADASGYVSELEGSEGRHTLNSVEAAAAFTGLVPNRRYFFQVTALLGAASTDPAPAFLTSTTLPEPPAPVVVPMPGMLSATSIHWDWRALAADRAVTITVRILRDDGGNTAAISQSPAETGDVVDWAANSSIRYRLELSCPMPHAPGGVNRSLSAPVHAVLAPGSGAETLGGSPLPHHMAIQLLRMRGGV